MADKFRTTFPISISFSDGELPTAAKLSGIASQARQGLSLVEYALGDLWNQSGDGLLYSSSSRLMISNIARYLGEAEKLNPRIPYLPSLRKYVHDFTNSNGKNEARLPFPPHTSSTYSWNNGFSGTPEATKANVDASGKWWIDTSTGDIFTYDLLSTGDQLTYQPGYIDSAGSVQYGVYGDLDTTATFNIIPDPDTSTSYNFRGLKLEYKNGSDDSEGYLIYLPPRQPLDTRRVDKSPQNDSDPPAHSGNIASAPDSSHDPLFFQADNVAACTNDATRAEHYRYNLPKVITDNWGQASSIPAGLVYLWDPYGSGTIIEGILFSAENIPTPRKWVLIASGANLTTWLSTSQGQSAYPSANLTSSSHDPSYYPNTGLRLITVGSSISATLSALLKQFINHDHGSQGSLVTPAISHNKLDSLFDSTISPQLDPSNFTNDDHPQYLHRYGTLMGRDKFKNGMLGDLLLLSTDSSSNYQNITSSSNRIYFGKSTAASSIYWSSSNNCLELKAQPVSNVGSVRLAIEGDTNYLNFGLTNTAGGGPSNKITSSHGLEISASGDITFSTGLNHVVLGLTYTSTRLYFSTKAVGDYLLNRRIGPGLTFYTGDSNADSAAMSSFPGMLRVRSTGDPELGFSRDSDSQDTSIKCTSDGLLEIWHPSKATGGDSTSLLIGKIYPGKHTDATYGDSGGYWGPVRELFISPAEFLYFQNNYSTYVPGSTGLLLSPTTQGIRGFGGDATNIPFDYVGELKTGDTQKNFAITFINIPAARYAIVGAKLSFRHMDNATNTPVSVFYAILGTNEVDGTGGSIVLTQDMKTANDSRGTGSSLAVDIWSPYFSVFAINTASTYIDIDQENPGGSKRPWFAIEHRGGGYAPGLTLQWRGVAIQYRIYQH